jgi:hypothetical protein
MEGTDIARRFGYHGSNLWNLVVKAQAARMEFPASKLIEISFEL